MESLFGIILCHSSIGRRTVLLSGVVLFLFVRRTSTSKVGELDTFFNKREIR